VRRTGIRRRPRTNTMSAESHDRVIAMDGQCVTILLDPFAGVCHDRFGNPHVSWDRHLLTVDHVKDAPMMGDSEDRDDVTKCVALCYHHHLNGWATANRPLLRLYLKYRTLGMEPVAAARAARLEAAA
jgi:hypothetical protein